MQGVIVNFRGSHKTKYDNHMIVKVSGYDTKEKAGKLLEKHVTWKTKSGKEIKGKIVKAHGNSGALRVQFEKGLPGQSVGKIVSFS